MKRGKGAVRKSASKKKKKDNSKLYIGIAIAIVVLLILSFMPFFHVKTESSSSDSSGLSSLNGISFWAALTQAKATNGYYETGPAPTPSPTKTPNAYPTATSTETPSPSPSPTKTATPAKCVPGTRCRPSAGICDVEEKWTDDCVCPPDKFKDSSVVCRPAAGVCDETEKCSGYYADCPDDSKKSINTICDKSTDQCKNDAKCDNINNNCPAKTDKPDGTKCTISTSTKPGSCVKGVCMPWQCDDDKDCKKEPPFCEDNEIRQIPVVCDYSTHQCKSGDSMLIKDCGPEYVMDSEICISSTSHCKPLDFPDPLCDPASGGAVIGPCKWCIRTVLGNLQISTRTGTYVMKYHRNYCESATCKIQNFRSSEECTSHSSIQGNFNNEPAQSCNGNICDGSCWSSSDCRFGNSCIGAQSSSDKPPQIGHCQNGNSIPPLFANCYGTGSHSNEGIACSGSEICASDDPSLTVSCCHVANYDELGCSTTDPNSYGYLSICLTCTPVSTDIAPECISFPSGSCVAV